MAWFYPDYDLDLGVMDDNAFPNGMVFSSFTYDIIVALKYDGLLVTRRWPYPYFPKTSSFLVNYFIVATAGSVFSVLCFKKKVLTELKLKMTFGIKLLAFCYFSFYLFDYALIVVKIQCEKK